ncbi:Type II secretion system (T2SS), protein M [Alicyclobacillus hesperidum]|uniref:Type II secretion system (T2SS), protein M n=1 Tax=Alicyclobacillus hesperidum TaxID=89784 RepID=A0A1H2UPL3_9BACL|nr:type II secretion system protein GspM [Alicyclobacillus hesperidum]SDW58035.1 Type II secretion system (T2SS), protein M [Alicyclobacillus hesperidum]
MKRQLSRRERVLLYGAGVLAAVALVYVYGLAPMLNRLSALQTQRQSLVATMNSLSEHPATKASGSKGGATVDIHTALPVGENEPSFLQLLAAAANANNVTLLSVARMDSAGGAVTLSNGSSTAAAAAEQSALANSAQAQAALQALEGQLGDTGTNSTGPLEVGSAGIPSLDYAVTVSGSAKDIEALLANLYHSQRLLDVYVADLKGLDGATATANLQIAAYYQPAN